jgi:hypothetical protein
MSMQPAWRRFRVQKKSGRQGGSEQEESQGLFACHRPLRLPGKLRPDARLIRPS